MLSRCAVSVIVAGGCSFQSLKVNSNARNFYDSGFAKKFFASVTDPSKVPTKNEYNLTLARALDTLHKVSRSVQPTVTLVTLGKWFLDQEGLP